MIVMETDLFNEWTTSLNKTDSACVTSGIVALLEEYNETILRTKPGKDFHFVLRDIPTYDILTRGLHIVRVL